MCAADYRVDRISKTLAANLANPVTGEYSIPCGMSHIVYLDNRPPSARFLRDIRERKKEEEVLLVSHWSYKNCSFEIVSTIL